MKLKVRLHDDISIIPGIGPKYKQILNSLNVKKIIDILTTYPKKKLILVSDTYKHGYAVAVNCTITNIIKYPQYWIVLCINNNNDSFQFTFFNTKSRGMLYPRLEICVTGMLERYHNKNIIKNPSIFSGHRDEIRTIKYECNPVPDAILQKGIKFILEHIDCADIMHRAIQSDGFISMTETLKHMHMSFDSSELELAQTRMALNEAILYCSAIKNMESIHSKTGKMCDVATYFETESLNFELTNSQKSALQDIVTDLRSSKNMFRILYGDVGSGKSIIAFLSMMNVSAAGYQAILLAPTEVLAKQHYESIQKISKRRIYLIVSGMKVISYPHNAIVIGTHALLYRVNQFKNVGLLVIDEQHKFGVYQRILKTNNDYNLLLMTATPIPRTLSMSNNKLLSQSSIFSEFRYRNIDKIFVSIDKIEQIYTNISKTIAENVNLFWICPLIRASEYRDFGNVVDRYQDLNSRFPDKVMHIHSKMSSQDKDYNINRFKQNNGMILVSTTIIEVGLDIPSADVMIIENPETFGLAQLYQLMGRVGRGHNKGVCYFLFSKMSEQAKERMQAIKNSTSGLELSTQDAYIRGTGNIFGTKQSGKNIAFKFLNLDTDYALIAKAKEIIEHNMYIDTEFLKLFHKTIYTDAVFSG